MLVSASADSGKGDEEPNEDEEPPMDMDSDGPVFDDSASMTDFMGGEGDNVDPPSEEDMNGDSEAQDAFVDQEVTAASLHGLHVKMDANKDNKLTLPEVLEFAKVARRDIAHKETAAQFNETIDEDQDGKVSLEEYTNHLFGHSIPEEVVMPEKTEQEVADEAHTEMDKLKEAEKFKAADKDGDGFLSKEELPLALYPELHDGVLHLTAGHGLKDKDKDGDGHVSHEELYSDSGGSETEELIEENKREFGNLDHDKDGKLNLEEYKRWESGVHSMEDSMKHLFEIADEDQDKHITATELENARVMLSNTMATSHFVDWVEHYEL